MNSRLVSSLLVGVSLVLKLSLFADAQTPALDLAKKLRAADAAKDARTDARLEELSQKATARQQGKQQNNAQERNPNQPQTNGAQGQQASQDPQMMMSNNPQMQPIGQQGMNPNSGNLNKISSVVWGAPILALATYGSSNLF